MIEIWLPLIGGLVLLVGGGDLLVRGAVRAALWARGQKPGYYSMLDVLGLADRA